jgi:hypothetical protein
MYLFIFKLDVPADYKIYKSKLLTKQYQFFRSFPLSYKGIANNKTLTILTYVIHGVL